MTIIAIYFWQCISIYRGNTRIMKTIANLINRLSFLFNTSNPKNELMPKLIPVRVITNRIPRQKDH